MGGSGRRPGVAADMEPAQIFVAGQSGARGVGVLVRLLQRDLRQPAGGHGFSVLDPAADPLSAEETSEQMGRR
jgi:hypothetical protein